MENYHASLTVFVSGHAQQGFSFFSWFAALAWLGEFSTGTIDFAWGLEAADANIMLEWGNGWKLIPVYCASYKFTH